MWMIFPPHEGRLQILNLSAAEQIELRYSGETGWQMKVVMPASSIELRGDSMWGCQVLTHEDFVEWLRGMIHSIDLLAGKQD
ncbi:MAG: hypothetical protein QXV20_06095 [Candidatus Hadarchaeales archaeon]